MTEEITALLRQNGIEFDVTDTQGFPLITSSSGSAFIPVEICCTSPDEAKDAMLRLSAAIGLCEAAGRLCEYGRKGITGGNNSSNQGHMSRQVSRQESRPILILQDRWNRSRDLLSKRILSHCGVFKSVFARNCEVKRIEKTQAKEFLKKNHSYGTAECRYFYGLYERTGPSAIAAVGANSKIADSSAGSSTDAEPSPIAVAGFSNARRWIKGKREIKSYEWVRYASLPDVRIAGGMGKILQTFIREVSPDDIMSYADLEWSDGDVYTKLGFSKETVKSPVLFRIDKETWSRIPAACAPEESDRLHQNNLSCQQANLLPRQDDLYYMNPGSAKYRLKLTEY